MVFAGRLLNMIKNGRPRLTQGWSKPISLHLVGGVEPCNGIICHRPPIDKGIDVLISKKQHTEENLTMCKKLIQSRQPLHLQIQYVLEENDHNLLIVQETPGVTLHEFFKRHKSQFFVGNGEKVLYVTPLFQRLLRDMIMATEELHHMGLNIFPLESSVFINIGEAGTLTIKISALRCVASTPENYQDPIVGSCAEIMKSFADGKLASIPELDDLVAKAETGKWCMDLHIYARSISTEVMEELDVLMQVKVKRLQDFAQVLKDEWDSKMLSCWTGNWVDKLQIIKPQKWEALEDHHEKILRKVRNLLSHHHDLDYFRCSDFAQVLKDEWDSKMLSCWTGNWVDKLQIIKPQKWEALEDHHEKILRKVRNLLSHHHDLDYFRCSDSWGNRKELFIHTINQTHNLTIMLYETYLEIKKKYMEKTLQGTRTTDNWDDVLSSILPKDNSHTV